jgi:hypothetical protein
MVEKKIVLITWESCGHCHTMLDEVWNPRGGAKEQITKNGWIIVHEKIGPGSEGKIEWANSHPDLKKYVRWYPCLLKFSGSTPDVFGGVYRNGQLTFDHNSDFSIDNIVRWAGKCV